MYLAVVAAEIFPPKLSSARAAGAVENLQNFPVEVRERALVHLHCCYCWNHCSSRCRCTCCDDENYQFAKLL